MTPIRVNPRPDDLQRFTLTEQHVKLLRAANVRWSDMEWGAPEIDGKRPYGNGDLHDDIASIIGEAATCPNCDHNVLGEADRARLFALHRETEKALQVVLAAGSFEPGEYVAAKYGSNWRRAR